MSVRLLATPRRLHAGIRSSALRPLWASHASARCSSTTRRLMVNMAAAEVGPQSLEEHRKRSWEFFRSIGSPAMHVAPMVDQSELAFRMLCRQNGATAAYTPMLHARIFSQDPKYRAEHFTTCEGDRPLLVQFCGNDADTVLAAARHVEDQVDAVDLNFGCPQRIARRGKYGAFLMDDLDLVERMVTGIAAGLQVPLTAKIRIFPELTRTLEYARMLERCGVQVLAVHGRTRDQKDSRAHRADWDAIKAVREAVGIPVLANGNILCRADADACMAHTGAQGVLSADPLLVNPALFSDAPLEEQPWAAAPATRGCELLRQYLDLIDEYPTPSRMVRAHVHKLLGDWLQEHVDLRDQITVARFPSTEVLRPLVAEMARRIIASGRDYPVPKLSEKKLAKRKADEELQKRKAAEEQQKREELSLQQIAARDQALQQAQTQPQPQQLLAAEVG